MEDWLIYISVAFTVWIAFNGKREQRYKNWYRPWLLFILTLIMLWRYPAYKLGFFGFHDLEIDVAYSTIVLFFWIIIKFFLYIFKVNDLLYPLLKKYNMDRVMERKKGYANYLLWPYFNDLKGVKFRPGHNYFKTLFLFAALFIVLAGIWTYYAHNKYALVLPTLYSLLAVPIFLEWVAYFGWKPLEEEKPKEESEEEEDSDFLKLYVRYISADKGFFESIIWGQIYSKPDDSYLRQAQSNREYLNIYEDKIINKNTDLIIGSDNFADVIPQVSGLLLDTLRKGGNILLIADIPNHTVYRPASVGIRTKDNQLKSITELFGIYLQQLLEYNIPSAGNLIDIGFFSSKDKSGLSKRIVICSAEDAVSKDLIHSAWMKEMDLVTVLHFNDTLANNLAIKRQISLWLKQQKKSYKSLFLKNYSVGGDEAVSNTWISTKDVPEVTLQNIQSAKKNYFINFAYEHSVNNLNKILVGNVNEFDLAPGIELAVFPILENIDHIHYFEGYNTDFIQSKNKLENLQKSFKKSDGFDDGRYNYFDNAAQSQLTESILVNNLPFIIHPLGNPECEDNHLSVVFDSINNAPKLYKKYMHLGKEQAFVCIVSKPHLMREYFAENINYFTASTIEPLEPQLSKSKINLCLELLALLINEKIDIQFIKSQINSHSIELKEQSIVSFIKELFNRYLYIDISKNAVLKAESKYVFRDGNYYHLHSLSMDQTKLEVNEIFEYLQKVKVVDASNNLILEIPKYLLFQNFLPQQNIIIDGISYEYVKYSDLNKELVLRTKPTDNFSFNKPEAVIRLVDANQMEDIDIKDNPGIFIGGKLHKFSTVIKESEIEIFYTGYYKFNRLYHSPFSKRQTPKHIDLKDFEDLRADSIRKYNTRFLQITWEVPKKYQARLPELTTRFHQLLYEFMPILFPHRYQYLQIASNNSYDENYRKKLPWIFPENNFEYAEPDCLQLFIVEDSFADLGTLKPIQNFFEKILIDLYFYLNWLKDKQIPSDIQYVQSIRQEKFFKDKLSFLKYGLSDAETAWDIDFLLAFLRDSKLFDPESIGKGYGK